jgi:PAS domain S-box-containing protein
MDLHLNTSAREINRLQRCIDDLVALLALPAVWSGREPAQIVETLLDVLLRMLHVDLICARVKDPLADAPIEAIRVAPSCSLSQHEISEMLRDWSEGHGQESLASMRNRLQDKDISIIPVPLGRHGETGLIVVGSNRADFPGQTESLLLSVAANQASIALKEACLLSEQKRAASQLEKQVAERTEGLAAANEKLKKSEAALHKAVDEIKKSEAKLRQVIDAIPTLAWCNLPDGPNEFLNKGWHEYTGLSPEESHGWLWQAAFHPEDLPPLMEKWRKMLISGESDEIEARLRRHDGVYRWFLIRAQAFRDDSGNIVRWYGTSTDIEDRKRAEEAQRATERNLAAIINTIPTTSWTTRPDGYCDFLNHVWLDYAGMTAEQAQGWGWADAIHPEDRKKLMEDWQSCLASGTPVDTEARIRRFDACYRWFLIRGNPLRDESGNILKWYGTCVDIEDRKLGEEALRARELSWRQIVDSIPGLVATMGPMGEVEFLNRQTLEYFGRTNEELKDWSLIGAVHPDDLPGVIAARQKCIETGQIYEVEHRCRRADGIYRWFQVRGLPVRNEEGTITAWYLLLTDIDDRKRAEQKLRQSEQDLRTITDAIRQSIVVLAPDGSTLYANRVALDRTGLTLGEANYHGFFTRVFHPDDADRLLAERQQGLSHGGPFELESRLRQRNGEYRWQLIQYNPLKDEQGQIIRWYATATDIDDRKRAEARVEQAYLRLAEAQRLSKTGSFITDLLADNHDWSEETFRIFEFDPSTKVTVQMIRDIIHPEDLPTFDAVIARGMTGTDVDFVFRIVPARGAVKHIHGMARVMTQVGGHPLFIGALQDVTESKVAEEALDRARSELAHVARVTTLNALTASIAHEINQPLSGIITNASTCLRMLNGDPPNIDGARETVRRTLRDGNRASDVIARLRTLFSRKEFTPESLDLNEATREVIALSLSDLQRNRVVLRSELSEDLPSVVGDRIQLQQVTLNLLRNASDAMIAVEDRPRQLLIRTQREGDDRVRLSVRDAGIGVNSQDLERLFEAFYTTKNGGMGIGLSVSRSIIERHHGRLWAEPNDGPGVTFAFSIPCSIPCSLEGPLGHGAAVRSS